MIRTKLVSAGRIAAIVILVSIGAALTVYLTSRSRPVEDKSGRPKLQGRVVAVFTNTRYAHEVEGKVRFALTAGIDRSYEDGTHELEEVKLESFGSDGTRHDVAIADKARVSDPSDLNKLDAELISNVRITTGEGLTVKTNYLHYDNAKNVVDTNELVEFSNDSMFGRSKGLSIDMPSERVTLMKAVDVTISAEQAAEFRARSEGSVKKVESETPEQKAERKARKRARKLERKRLKALRREQTRVSDRKDKKDKKKPGPVHIVCDSAVLEKKEGRITLQSNVLVERNKDEMRANRMVAFIAASDRFERIEARGNARLQQKKKSEVTSEDMDFFFDEEGNLIRANATGGVHTRSLGEEALRESQSETLEAMFVEGSEGAAAETITATGNAVVKLHAPRAAERKAEPGGQRTQGEASVPVVLRGRTECKVGDCKRGCGVDRYSKAGGEGSESKDDSRAKYGRRFPSRKEPTEGV